MIGIQNAKPAPVRRLQAARLAIATKATTSMNAVLPCTACPHNGLGFCGAMLRDAEVTGAEATGDWHHHRIVPAGQQVLAPNHASADVFVLCSGWAFRSVRLSNGRRQILNFLLPGDLFSASAVFNDCCQFSVTALTTVQISGMRRTQVHSRLVEPAVAAAVGKCWATEAQSSDSMMAVLGRARRRNGSRICSCSCCGESREPWSMRGAIRARCAISTSPTPSG